MWVAGRRMNRDRKTSVQQLVASGTKLLDLDRLGWLDRRSCPSLHVPLAARLDA